MRLYFLRHGEAEERAAGLPDAKRKLTPEGIDEMEGVAEGMRALGLEFDALLTSPLVRARETAVIAARALGQESRLREEPLLASGCTLGELVRAVGGLPEGARVLLVGHEPDFSSGISGLIGGGAVRMKKAALACVAWTPPRPGTGELRWILEPEHLVALGKGQDR